VKVAERTRAHPRSRLANRRVVAVNERHGGHEACGAGELGQLDRSSGVQGNGLLTDDVLAGLQGRARQRQVKVVGSADVDDVDVVRGNQILRRGVPTLGAQLLACALLSIRGRGRAACDHGSRESRGARVHATDEAGSDDSYAWRVTRGVRHHRPLDGEGSSLSHMPNLFELLRVCQAKVFG
jgi:hypothetical protein